MNNDMNKLSDEVLENIAGGVTEDEALERALAYAGLKVDPKTLRARIHKDREDGFKVYEIKFFYNGMEYEFDVDAVHGNILKFEKDYD